MPLSSFARRLHASLLALPALVLWGLAAAPAAAAAPETVAARHAPEAATRPFTLCGAYCAIVDAKGTLVSPRVFERIGDTADGVIIYGHDGRHGALDTRGRRILKPIYDHLYILEGQSLIKGLVSENGASGPPTELLFGLDGRLVLKRANERVDAWQGRPYYKTCTDASKGQPGAAASCHTVFTDRRGKPVATFAYFAESSDSSLAVASLDGKTFGYIGPDLQFRIPPRYSRTDSFQGGYAIVHGPEGAALIDAQGKVRVPMGRFKQLFGYKDDLFYIGFANDDDCGRFVRRDGSLVTLPEHVCPGSSSRSRQYGYTLVHGPHGIGAIDASGRIIIEPRYATLSPLTRRYLAFSRAGHHRGPYGMLDRSGNVLIQPGYELLKPGPGGTVLAQTPRRDWVLLDSHGKELSTRAFHELETLSPSLIAYSLREADGRIVHGFMRPDGTLLPQRGRAGTIAARDAEGRPSRFILSVHIGPGVFKKGLMDAQGNIVIAPQEHVAGIEPIGGGLWRVERHRPHSGQADTVYNASGEAVAALAPYDDISAFRNGVATARQTAQRDPVLITMQGRVLASYQALFPQYTSQARDGDQLVKRTLDVCYVADPAAEPEDQPAPHGAARRICADPALRALSRQTEKAYYSAQAGPCLPSVFMKMRPPYDDAVDACTDAACLRRVMLIFQDRLSKAAEACARAPSNITWSDKPVAGDDQAAITKIVAAGGDGGATGADGAAPGGRDSLDFSALALGKMPAALVTQATYAHNQPFWLMTKNRRGQWRVILHDYAGYLRGFDVAGATHKGMPILRIQQHASCCEHDVRYFQYNGEAYRPRRNCTQLYDNDETPILLCGPLAADAAPGARHASDSDAARQAMKRSDLAYGRGDIATALLYLRQAWLHTDNVSWLSWIGHRQAYILARRHDYASARTTSSSRTGPPPETARMPARRCRHAGVFVPGHGGGIHYCFGK